MDTRAEAIAQQVEAFTEANRRSLDVLGAAIHRATGDDELICSARAWLLFRWARAQREPRAVAAAMVRRMNEERLDETSAASNSGVHLAVSVGDHAPAALAASS